MFNITELHWLFLFIIMKSVFMVLIFFNPDIDPVFLSPSSQSVIDKQQNPVWFQCISGNSRPPSTITWEKDGVQVTESPDILYYEASFGGEDSLMTSGTLQINSVGKKHEGRYQCLVHNPLLPNQVQRSGNFTLTVNRKWIYWRSE